MPIILQKKKIVLALVIIALAAIAFYLLPQEEQFDIPIGTTSVVDTRCYGTRDISDEEGDVYNLVMITFYSDETISSFLDYGNGSLNSSGTIKGVYTQENNQINGMYDFSLDNELYSEERYIRFNGSGLVFGFGEMYQDDEGVMRYADTSAINFDYPLPMISCERHAVWKREYEKITGVTSINL